MLPLFIHLRILDILDIILVALLFSQLYRLIRGTIAINIFVGIFSVYLFWLLVKALDMELLSSILGQFIGVGVIALLIVFQQEIRRFLLILGGRYTTRGWNLFDKIFSSEGKSMQESKINDIISACENMSGSRTGALIIIARKSELDTIIETGDILNADISARFLESIFFGNNPLHDGAVIIVDERIKAARCVLPTTENIYLPAKYGMRHRAAVGMTERTDAIAVVVSEESGEISLSVEGELLSGLKPDELKGRLINELK